MTIHSEGINPTGNTQLVDENTRIVLEFVAGRRSGMCTQTEIRDAARAVLDALAAQTRPHTDDERQDLIDLIDIASDGTHPPAGVVIVTSKEAGYYADRILAAGFRRTEVPEPSADWDRVHDRPADIYTPPEDRIARQSVEPQGEPSDTDLIAWHVEQVEALRPFTRSSSHLKAAMMHAATVRALRAVEGVR